MASDGKDLEQRMGGLTKVSPKLFDFQHRFNPQHYYCRLRELGMDKKIARRLSEQYEKDIYSVTIEYFKNEVKE